METNPIVLYICTNIYHVDIRSINQQNIFVDDVDNGKFIATLAR
jgi:hypothetical protein